VNAAGLPIASFYSSEKQTKRVIKEILNPKKIEFAMVL